MNNDAVYDIIPVTRKKVTDFVSPEEVAALRERSDLWGAWGILSTWIVIFGASALVGWGLIHGLTTLYLSGHLRDRASNNGEFMDLVESAIQALRTGWQPKGGSGGPGGTDGRAEGDGN